MSKFILDKVSTFISKIYNSKSLNFIQDKLYYLLVNILIVKIGKYRYKTFGYNNRHNDVPIIDICYILWFWYNISKLILLKKDTDNTICIKIFISFFIIFYIAHKYNLLCNY